VPTYLTEIFQWGADRRYQPSTVTTLSQQSSATLGVFGDTHGAFRSPCKRESKHGDHEVYFGSFLKKTASHFEAALQVGFTAAGKQIVSECPLGVPDLSADAVSQHF